MRKIILLVIVSLLAGCEKNVDSVSIDKIVINPDNVLPSLDLTPYYESIDLIPLETSDQCFLSVIKKILLYNNNIYISDKNNTGVFIFDMNGKFIKKIGTQGSGPDEIIFMGDFLIAEDCLYIQDLYGAKYIIYDLLKNKTRTMKYNPHHLEIISNDGFFYFISNYFSSNDGYFNLFKLDPSSNKIIKHLPFDKEISKKNLAWAHSRYSTGYGESHLIIYPRNDTIYELKNRKVDPKYIIEFSKNYIPDDLKDADARTVWSQRNSRNFIMGLDYIQQTHDKILCTFVHGNSYRYLLIDKTNLSYEIFNKIVVGNMGSLSLYNYTVMGMENCFISYYDMDAFKNNWSNVHQYEKVNDEFRQKINNIVRDAQDDDNPIIFIFKLKVNM